MTLFKKTHNFIYTIRIMFHWKIIKHVCLALKKDIKMIRVHSAISSLETDFHALKKARPDIII